MIKELSLAIILGLLIGFGLTGTFFFVRQSSNKSQNTVEIKSPSPIPTTSDNSQALPTPIAEPSTNPNLEITSHQNNDIVATSKITLTGNTNPKSQVIITTLSKNYRSLSDNQGKFSQSIDLEPGLNIINISAISENNQENQAEIYLTYSTAKF